MCNFGVKCRKSRPSLDPSFWIPRQAVSGGFMKSMSSQRRKGEQICLLQGKTILCSQHPWFWEIAAPGWNAAAAPWTGKGRTIHRKTVRD